MVRDDEEFSDVYDDTETLREADEIDVEEEGFMQGYEKEDLDFRYCPACGYEYDIEEIRCPMCGHRYYAET